MPDPLPRVTRTRLYEQVAEEIDGWIQSTGMGAGDRTRRDSPAGDA